jgi:hypothetical protein
VFPPDLSEPIRSRQIENKKVRRLEFQTSSVGYLRSIMSQVETPDSTPIILDTTKYRTSLILQGLDSFTPLTFLQSRKRISSRSKKNNPVPQNFMDHNNPGGVYSVF